MSDIRFVIESSFQKTGEPGYETLGIRPKRVKSACLGCQARKGRCSGTQPCHICKLKNVPCIYRDSSRTGRSGKDNKVNDKSDSKGSQKRASTSDIEHGVRDDGGDDIKTKKHRTTSSNSNDYSTSIPPDSTGSSSAKKVHTRTTRHPYFRWLGPTAIAPPKDGIFRLLSVNLRSNEPDNDGHYVVVERKDDSSFSSSPVLQQEENEFDSSSYVDHIVPLPSKNLYKLFNEKMSNFLPYLPYEIFEERLANGVIGECLLYAVASLAERVTPINIAACNVSKGSNLNQEPRSHENTKSNEDTTDNSLAEKYSETAKRLIIPHLSCPSVEIVFALLLIAYCEFGDDHDSGLWTWSGIAIRMSYDLGLQKAAISDSDSFAKNVFWSVLCLDRLISCGTGRVTTIPDSVIEHDPEPRWIEGADGKKRSDPFPYLCKLLILIGKVSNYINSHTEENSNKIFTPFKDSLPPKQIDIIETFAMFQQEVSDFYTTLPSDLLFDVQNFQEFAKINCSQVFLLLHIWNQALVLAVHQPSLVYPKCQLDISGLVLHPHAELTGSGAISIADMVTFADLIEPESFLTNPFIGQPIFMAACASLTLWRSLKVPFQSQPVYTLQRTYNACRQTLNRIEKIWRGTSWLSRTLDSLAAAEPDVDLSVNSKVYVTTRDLGVVRRASVDESTRRWLADEIKHKQVDDIYGMFISGTIDGEEQYEKSPTSTTSGDLLYDVTTTSRFNEDGMVLFDSRPQHSVETGIVIDNFNQQDTFKNLVIRDMNLNEFFNDDENLADF